MPTPGERLRERLRAGVLVRAINPDHPSPSLAEHLGRLGVEALWIDREHGTADLTTVQDMCRAARAASIPALVRAEAGVPYLLRRYLDCGADGIVVPLVASAEEAREVVGTIRGARPLAPDAALVVVMVETTSALAEVGSIAAVPGVDVVFIGPTDLSQSMGLPGQPWHPEVQARVAEGCRAIRAAGRPAGTLVTRDNVGAMVAAGARLLYEHANSFLAHGWRDFAALSEGSLRE